MPLIVWGSSYYMEGLAEHGESVEIFRFSVGNIYFMGGYGDSRLWTDVDLERGIGLGFVLFSLLPLYAPTVFYAGPDFAVAVPMEFDGNEYVEFVTLSTLSNGYEFKMNPWPHENYGLFMELKISIDKDLHIYYEFSSSISSHMDLFRLIPTLLL